MTSLLEAPAGAGRVAVQDAAPFALSLIPFGLALGAASSAAGIPSTSALFGAVVMLAGAGQLTAVESIGRGDSVVVVALLVALVNLRFVLYGAGVADWFRAASMRRRLALAFPVVDQTFLLCQQRFAETTDLQWRQRYYLTVTAMLAGTFVGAQAVALQFGAHLPDSAGLHLAAPLAFAGLLSRSLPNGRAAVAAAISAMAVVAGAPLLGAGALPAGVVLGVVAAQRGGRS